MHRTAWLLSEGSGVAWSTRPAPAFNVHPGGALNYPGRGAIGSRIKLDKLHTRHDIWYKSRWFQAKPFAMNYFVDTPRMLLDRDFYKYRFQSVKNLAFFSRWERVVDSKRGFEDRWWIVEEEGESLKVNYKLYSERLNNELRQIQESLPQLTIIMKGVPYPWKKMEISCAVVQGLSLREAMAQCKFGLRKGHLVLYRAFEKLLQGAEAKGLDKDKLRVTRTHVAMGSRDKQIDIKSKGYYAWRTKRSCLLLVSVTEDPDMVLPDRTIIPYRSQVSLRKAGIRTEATILDVPAITAEGI